jgi:hypothetical protein
MRILGSAQHQVVPFKDVNKAGIAFDYFDCEVQNPIKRLVEIIRGGYPAD